MRCSVHLIKGSIFITASYLSACSTVERPDIKTWQPPKWVNQPGSNTGLQHSTPLIPIPSSSTILRAIPIKKRVQKTQNNSPDNESKNPFWQRQISLNFEQISLKKAIDGLSKSQQFSYRNKILEDVKIDHYRAIKTPLIEVLEDLAELTNTRLVLKSNAIIFMENLPFWQQYTVNYPNIKRNSRSKTQFNQNVSAVQNQNNNSANVEINNEFKNEFWLKLEKLLNMLNATQSIPAVSTTSTIRQNVNKTQILTHSETGLVSVYGQKHLHTQVKNILKNVNQQAQRQAYIEIAIMEVELNDQYETGIDWSLFEDNNSISQQTIGANLGAAPRIFTNVTGVLDGISLNFGARLIEQFGTTKVLSSPQIRMINNQTSLLKVVDNLIYFTINTKTLQNNSAQTVSFETQAKSLSVGIVITLTTSILPDDSLIINLKPTISRVSNFVNDPHPELAKYNIQSLIPVIRERELESILHIRPNEVAVIGGLIQNRDNRQAQQSPGTGGFLGFNSTQKINTELILFLRANII